MTKTLLVVKETSGFFQALFEPLKLFIYLRGSFPLSNSVLTVFCAGLPKPFVCKMNNGVSMETKKNATPRHDANAPGALVMPRPSATHQVSAVRTFYTTSFPMHVQSCSFPNLNL